MFNNLAIKNVGDFCRRLSITVDTKIMWIRINNGDVWIK